jgi:CubicO group peptidase (beta-lactamase class C family)
VPFERQGTIAPFCPIGPQAHEPVDPWSAWFLDRPEVIAAGEPSHGIVASAADIVLLMQAVFRSGLWDLDVVGDAVRIRVTAPVEGVFGGGALATNQALFVTVAGEHYAGGLPRTASSATFGTSGAPSSFCFMDPASGLSFAFLTNGYPRAGYDASTTARNRAATLAHMAADVVLFE